MTLASAHRFRPHRWRRDAGRSHRAIVAMVLLSVGVLRLSSGEPGFEAVPLPPLRVFGQAASAHTQGLELVGHNYLVTARQENPQPKRALLLRTSNHRSDWDCWDITPTNPPDETIILDHPGGIQSDGERLWIPVAESRRKGRSRIRAYGLESLAAGRSLTPAFEFEVADHIGALAVSRKNDLLLGASWDTEKIYVWDLHGQLKRTLTNKEVASRGLGVTTSEQTGGGIAVQDWKMVGEQLFASGLFNSKRSASDSPASRFAWFDRFLDPNFRRQTIKLPRQSGVELAREAMAVSEGMAYFLPEDLGATNRLFRASLASLMEREKAK